MTQTPIEECDHVIFDIETEGLAGPEDRVINIGFRFVGEDGKHVVFYLDENVEDVNNSSFENDVKTIPCESERKLLEEANKFIEENRIHDGKSILFGYNANTRHGGFDVPFLRTRCSKNNINWLFKNVTHIDLYNVVKSEFNTKQPTVSKMNKKPLVILAEIMGLSESLNKNKQPLKNDIQNEEVKYEHINELLNDCEDVTKEDVYSADNSLEGAWNAIKPDTHYTNPNDPLEDSKEVPELFENGEMEQIIQHNVADLEMTELVRERTMEYVVNNYVGFKSNLDQNEM